MSTFTEEQLQEVRPVIQAIIRAANITGNDVSRRCASAELLRLEKIHGRKTMEAIARELDARAPLGGQSGPASQGEDQ